MKSKEISLLKVKFQDTQDIISKLDALTSPIDEVFAVTQRLYETSLELFALGATNSDVV